MLKQSRRMAPATLAAVLIFSAGLVISDSRDQQGGTPVVVGTSVVPDGTVVAGSDVGFIIERTTPNGRPQGRVVVRIAGQWVPAEILPNN
jgi:hypothetical protein